jgi:hypothetical protein
MIKTKVGLDLFRYGAKHVKYGMTNWGSLYVITNLKKNVYIAMHSAQHQYFATFC